MHFNIPLITNGLKINAYSEQFAMKNQAISEEMQDMQNRKKTFITLLWRFMAWCSLNPAEYYICFQQGWNK